MTMPRRERRVSAKTEARGAPWLQNSQSYVTGQIGKNAV